VDSKVKAAVQCLASDCKWVIAVVPHLMGSERDTLIDAREVALRLLELEEERDDNT